jgi:hypothetical protein
VPSDTGSGLVPAAGSIRGNVVYSGPHPCSSNGHIVGNAVVLVFDRRNLPPPNGLASTALNFGVVVGDALFANEPRNPGPDVYCPQDHGVTDTITVNAPFAIGPLNAGSYVLESFFDYTGDFFPTFKFRELPEQGDVAGGAIDTADALKSTNAGNPNYQPHFLPVDVGIPQTPLAQYRSFIPNFLLPDDGYVADNVTVTLGQTLALPRPYFYPPGAEVPFANTSATVQVGPPLIDGSNPPPDQGTVETDPNYAPVLTIPQDIEVYAPPTVPNKANIDAFQNRFPRLTLNAGVAPSEVAAAGKQPLHFQLPTSGPSKISVWQNASYNAATAQWIPQNIPEGNGVPQLWPLVVLTKLVDDPTHTLDPSSLAQQGSQTATVVNPVVVLQGITLLGNSLYNTIQAAAGGSMFDQSGRPVLFPQDQLTVLLRPNVICFDSLYDNTMPDKRGTLVTPYLLGLSADQPTGTPATPIVSPSVLMNPSIAALVSPPAVTACLPVGRYAINVVYPDGQAWTVPNESGACSGREGTTDYTNLTCTTEPRSVLRSQGTRAVVEITKATDPNHCAVGGYQAVPTVCLPHAPPDGGL